MKFFLSTYVLFCFITFNIMAKIPDGIITTVMLPLTQDQRIDHDALKYQINYLLGTGVHGIVMFGTLGEGMHTSDDQIIEAVKTASEIIRGRLPLSVGVIRTNSFESFDLAKKLKDTGVVDSLQVMFLTQPHDLKWEQLLSYYKALNDLDIDIIYYNYPAVSGFEIDPDQLEELFKLKNIMGIKNSFPNMKTIKKHIKLAKQYEKKVYIGVDYLLLDTLEAGGNGSIGPLGLYRPKDIVGVYNEFMNGNIEGAQDAKCNLFGTIYLFTDLSLSLSVIKKMFCSTGMFNKLLDPKDTSRHARLKEMLRTMNFPMTSVVKDPLPQLSEKDLEQIKCVQLD